MSAKNQPTTAVTTSEVQVEVQRGLRTFKVFEHAAKIVDYMAGLEQNERETKARIARLNADAVAAEAESKERIDAAHAAAEKAEADAAVAGAATTRKADALLIDANERAANVVETAERKVTTLTEILASRQKQADGLARDIDARRAELEAIDAKIVEAKKQVAKLLGA